MGGAKRGARRGALGGGITGGLLGGVLPLSSNALDARKDVLLKLMGKDEILPKDVMALGKYVQQMEELRDMVAQATPSVSGTFTGAAKGTAVSALGGAAAGHVAGRLRQKMFPNKKHDVASDRTSAYDADEAPEKSGAVHMVPPEDNPQDQRSRRIAELLKKAVPTSSAGGSASPTPPRGTP